MSSKCTRAISLPCLSPAFCGVGFKRSRGGRKAQIHLDSGSWQVQCIFSAIQGLIAKEVSVAWPNTHTFIYMCEFISLSHTNTSAAQGCWDSWHKSDTSPRRESGTPAAIHKSIFHSSRRFQRPVEKWARGCALLWERPDWRKQTGSTHFLHGGGRRLRFTQLNHCQCHGHWGARRRTFSCSFFSRRARVVVISFSASGRRVSLTPIKRIIKCEATFKKSLSKFPRRVPRPLPCYYFCIADFDLPILFFSRDDASRRID